MTKYYLAYGSNLNVEQMALRCPTAKIVGNTTLEAYRLAFRGNDGSAVATIEKDEDQSVPFLIWDIQPEDEAALDRYEGYPHLYRKVTVNMKLRKKRIEAMVYVMNEGRPLGIPSGGYLQAITQGYETAGFDEHKLETALVYTMLWRDIYKKELLQQGAAE